MVKADKLTAEPVSGTCGGNQSASLLGVMLLQIKSERKKERKKKRNKVDARKKRVLLLFPDEKTNLPSD